MTIYPDAGRVKTALNQRDPDVNIALSTIFSIIAAFLSGCADRGTATISRVTPPSPQTRIAIIVDQSKSMRAARAAAATPEDVRACAELVTDTGGDVAFTLIKTSSEDPLVRVHIDSAPIAPVKPNTDDDVLANAEEATRFRRESGAFDGAQRAWRENVAREIDTFVEAAGAKLDMPFSACRSDVLGAIQRVDLFFSEPTPTGVPAPRCVLLMFSDCLEDVHPTGRVVLHGQPLIIVVNGVGAVGVFAATKFAPLRFENKLAAISYLKKEINRGRL